MLLEEQERVSKRAGEAADASTEEARTAARAGETHGSAGSEGSGSTGGEASGSSDAVRGSGGVTGEHTGAKDGETVPSMVYDPPPDVGDGSDDDLVARQIREAATAEPDPELREKLWEEYRVYKESIR